MISIHALREEGDCRWSRSPSTPTDFYPRPPRGGRPLSAGRSIRPSLFLSTPSARRATSLFPGSRPAAGNFYPRPPRGGRLLARLRTTIHQKISIHALREEGDSAPISIDSTIRAFLSTPSARRATHSKHHAPLPPHISIHALREEGDSKNGEKHLRFCFTIKRSAQIWKSLSKNIRKKSRDLHRMP